MKQFVRNAVAASTTALLVIAQLAFAPAAQAATATVGNQLTTVDLTSPSLSALNLAQALVGPGVSSTVTNVTYTGAKAQLGTVHIADPAVVSFNDGVIMSSGYVADVAGPNKSEGTTGDMASQPGINAGAADTDLTALIANTATVNPMTYDAATLEFDFVPNASTVYFTYVFGSDEYLEWVNLFNDVFAFYITDASGHRSNCAVTPTGDPVSIDTINSNVNSGLYRDNSFWSPPTNPINFESDGLTVEMICSATVTPNVPNHIKLAIADTSDQILDSVVMLKSHTLSTTPPESCNNKVDDDGDNAVDMDDSYCQTTTTALPPGAPSGVGGTTTPAAPNFSNAAAFSGNEGEPLLLDANQLAMAPNPSTTYITWDVSLKSNSALKCQIVDANGNPVTSQNLITVGGTKVFPQAFAICPQDGEFRAWMHEWASALDSTNDNDIDFFVHNAPPVVDAAWPANFDVLETGVAFNAGANVWDNGGDAVTCTIKWGDGSTNTVMTLDPLVGSCSADHTYATDGDYVITISGKDAQGDATATASVVSAVTTGGPAPKLPQTIWLNTALPASVTYGDSFTVDASSDSAGLLSYTASGGCSNAGAVFTVTSATSACSIGIAQAGDATYDPASYTDSVGTSARAITVTAVAKTKVWGTADPALTFNVTTGNLVGADALAGSLTRTAGENLGTYAINQGTVTSANNSNYSVSFVSANLTITGVAPAVLTNPSAVTAAVGSTATFTASASGKPTPTVQWQVAAAGSTTFANIAGATSTSYSFVVASTDAGKQYRAVFTNALASATTTAAALSIPAAPTVTSITPTSGGVGTTVTINGTNLAGTTAVTFTGTTVTARFVVLSATKVIASVPSGATTGVIKVTTPAGTASTASFKPSTTLVVPTVTAYSVSAARPGSATTVTLTGTNFAGTASVALNGVALSYSVISATSIVATVPASGVTTGPIKVTTNGGTSVNTLAFTVAVAPVALAAGTSHSCALLADGTVKCWGLNTNGQLGNGTTTQSTSPVVVTGLTGAAAVSAGGSSSCAVLADGTAKCWGLNTNGQLGTGTTTQATTAGLVKLNATTTLTGVAKIVQGTAFACALLTDSTVKCWGQNANGQLGNGTTTASSYPVAVTGLTGVAAIAAGATHACAVLATGAVKCWGQNANGQLGNGATSTTAVSTPVAVTGIDGVALKATSVVAGTSYSCALISDATVRCWGINASGQLGTGTTTQSTTAVQVKTAAAVFLTGVTSLTAGASHACAIVGSGSTATARCWGLGTNGRLGNGAATNSSYAVAVVATLTTGLSALVAGGSHTLALVPVVSALAPSAGAAWGLNTNGQLGTGNTTAATSPVLLPAL